MKRTVQSISACYAYSSAIAFTILPVVPSTAQLTETFNVGANGAFRTFDLSATVSEITELMRRPLIIRVTLDDSSIITFGDGEIPVRLKLTAGSPVKMSCTYDCLDW